MKTTASNGTVLQVGKKYKIEGLLGIEYVEILDIGINEAWTVNSNGGKYSYSINQDWFPYEEPKQKPFEKYQKFNVLYHDGTIMEKFGLNKEQIQRSSTYINKVYTVEEVKELGLKI